MDFGQRTLRLLATCALALPGLLTVGATANAQTPAAETVVYETELTGWDIEIEGSFWVLDEENTMVEHYEHGDGERVLIDHAQGGAFVEISFFDDTDSPEETIEIMLTDFEEDVDTWEVLDEGNEGDVYFALARFEVDDTIGYFYIEVAEDVDGNIDLMQAISSTEEHFIEDVESATAHIIVDGEGFLAKPAIGDLEPAIEQATPASSKGN